MKKIKKEEIFEKNNYAVVRQAISEDLVSFVYAYFQNKRKATNHLFQSQWLSPFDTSWGSWEDSQIPNTYSHYADLAMETLMIRLLPLMQAVTRKELVPTYTYARIYKYGDTLVRHKDRASCEISCTLNLGGDPWPIYLEPSGETGKEGIQVNLNAGDMLIYRGTHLEHWREPFGGYDCGQVFMHYNDKNGEFGGANIYDGRPMIGLPSWFKKN
jgi:hypothetical protein|tara:strand:+ start:3650 stop:4291 length:642 start_codon:yes stop_codon:yes gene_type:complete